MPTGLYLPISSPTQPLAATILLCFSEFDYFKWDDAAPVLRGLLISLSMTSSGLIHAVTGQDDLTI